MESLRKRNASDGDSGFDSALSSRSSSISLEESQDLLDFKISKVEVTSETPPLRDQFSHILNQTEDIFKDVCTPSLYIIRDRESGSEIMYKPPSKLSFSSEPPRIGETFSAAEYNRCNPIPRSQLFNARLQLELEKQVAKMDLLEVNLVMDNTLVPPPSLGIRVIGVNMIHGVPDKLNIYVKRVMEGSVAGLDGTIKVNDHIVEVNGVSLIGVSQKLAAEALSSCAVNPETGVVNFVLARAPSDDPPTEEAEAMQTSDKTTDEAPAATVEKPAAVAGATAVAAAGERNARNTVDSSAVPTPSPPQTMHEASATLPLTSPSNSQTAAADNNVESAADELTRRKKIKSPVPSSSSPDLLIAASALHCCGESTAFLPLGPDTVRPRPGPSLSDLPAPILKKISSFLPAPRDKISLSNVNKSFYAMLMLEHEPPAAAVGAGRTSAPTCSSSSRISVLTPRSVKSTSSSSCSSRRSSGRSAEVSIAPTSTSSTVNQSLAAAAAAETPRMVPCV